MPTIPSTLRALLTARYGGRRPWLAHLGWKSAMYLGGLRSFGEFEPGRVDRVVFICAGNICRSAYAHRRALDLGLPADSCGLNVGTACRADASASQQAAQRGINLDAHVPKSITVMQFRETDLLAVMEPAHAKWLRARFSAPQIVLLGLWAHAPQPYIHDPYGHKTPYFQRCFRIIDESVEGITHGLRSGQTPVSPNLSLF